MTHDKSETLESILTGLKTHNFNTTITVIIGSVNQTANNIVPDFSNPFDVCTRALKNALLLPQMIDEIQSDLTSIAIRYPEYLRYGYFLYAPYYMESTKPNSLPSFINGVMVMNRSRLIRYAKMVEILNVNS